VRKIVAQLEKLIGRQSLKRNGFPIVVDELDHEAPGIQELDDRANRPDRQFTRGHQNRYNIKQGDRVHVLGM
jgi:hypothetical protein